MQDINKRDITNVLNDEIEDLKENDNDKKAVSHGSQEKRTKKSGQNGDNRPSRNQSNIVKGRSTTKSEKREMQGTTR